MFQGILRQTRLETHRQARSLRQVRQKTSLQTHRRPGNCAFLDAIASVCAAARRAGRQFAPLEGGQGVSLRRSRADRASICVGPKTPSGRLPARNGASTVITRKTGVWTLPVVRKTDALPDRRRQGGRSRGAEKKGSFALQKAYRSLKRERGSFLRPASGHAREGLKGSRPVAVANPDYSRPAM